MADYKSEELLAVPERRRNGESAVTLFLLLSVLLLVAAGFRYGIAGRPSEGDLSAKRYPAPIAEAGGTEDRAAQAADTMASVLKGENAALAAERNPYAAGEDGYAAGEDGRTAERGGVTAPAAPPEAEQLPAAPAVELPWNLILINRANPLPENYTAPARTNLPNGHSVDSRVYAALEQMLSDARAAGGRPYILSSFRTAATQKRLYQNRVRRFQNDGYSRSRAEELASHWVAIPNTSEHQMALAVDIVDQSFRSLSAQQASTLTQQWLMAHCAEYGFVLRYPSSKVGITGIGYEPWHYRYVGVEAAKEMTERGLCLEEYIAFLNGEA